MSLSFRYWVDRWQKLTLKKRTFNAVKRVRICIAGTGSEGQRMRNLLDAALPHTDHHDVLSITYFDSKRTNRPLRFFNNKLGFMVKFESIEETEVVLEWDDFPVTEAEAEAYDSR